VQQEAAPSHVAFTPTSYGRGVHLLTAVLVAALLTGCSAGTPVQGGGARAAVDAPDAAAGARIDGVQTYPYVAPDHRAAVVTYPQAPPVGGDHWPPSAGGVTGWLSCGTYAAAVPDEFAVHSLEHGAVWLTYLPGRAAAALAGLAALRPDYVLVSPYAGQRGPYAATAWGAQLFVDRADDPRLAEFVRAYAGGAQGREPGAPCRGGATPAQAQAALDAVR